MIRRLLYASLLIAVFFAPVKRVNVSDLEPVEALLITRTGTQVSIVTDTGISATGEDISQAIENLRENMPGILYLDTVSYVVLTESSKDDLAVLQSYLKKRVEICIWEEMPPENWQEHLVKKTGSR